MVPLVRSCLRRCRQGRAWNSPWKTPSCLLAEVPSSWANRFRVTTVTRENRPQLSLTTLIMVVAMLPVWAMGGWLLVQAR